MDGGSGSAILPPKRPPRTPLKLSLTPQPPSTPSLSVSLPGSRPSSSSGRPSLKLPGVTSNLASLSLDIPQAGPSRYRSALNGPQDSDDEGAARQEEDDDDDDEEAKWGEGDQERMAGELLDVIRGPIAVGLEDELSGRTRRMSALAGAAGHMGMGSRRPSTTASLSESEAEEDGSPKLGGDGSAEGDQAEALKDLEVTPDSIQDLGRLGEGASGEVRKVLHRPSGQVMAKKVRSFLFHLGADYEPLILFPSQTIATSPNPKLHKQHLRELLFMRECSHPAIVQYYGAFLEDVSFVLSCV